MENPLYVLASARNFIKDLLISLTSLLTNGEDAAGVQNLVRQPCLPNMALEESLMDPLKNVFYLT